MRNAILAAAAALLCVPATAWAARATPYSITASATACTDATAVLITLPTNSNISSLGLSVQNSFSATLQFRVSTDGAQFVAPEAMPLGGGASVSSTTAAGQWTFSGANVYQVCVYASTYASGTPAILIDLGVAESPVGPIEGPLADGASAAGHNPLFDGLGFNKTVLAPRYCDKSIAFTTQSTTSIVKQIAEVAGQHIYVCGWILHASTATTGTSLTWYSGSGASCGSGSNAAVGGPIIATTPTAAPATPNSSFGPSNPALRLTLAAGDALCTKQASTSNATTLSGTIFYTQN